MVGYLLMKVFVWLLVLFLDISFSISEKDRLKRCSSALLILISRRRTTDAVSSTRDSFRSMRTCWSRKDAFTALPMSKICTTGRKNISKSIACSARCQTRNLKAIFASTSFKNPQKKDKRSPVIMARNGPACSNEFESFPKWVQLPTTSQSKRNKSWKTQDHPPTASRRSIIFFNSLPCQILINEVSQSCNLFGFLVSQWLFLPSFFWF